MTSLWFFLDDETMKFRAKIVVRTKEGQIDPEGDLISKSLLDLDLVVSRVRTGKIYDILLNAKSKKDAEATVRLICWRLLVNPVKDDYEVEVEEVRSSKSTP